MTVLGRRGQQHLLLSSQHNNNNNNSSPRVLSFSYIALGDYYLRCKVELDEVYTHRPKDRPWELQVDVGVCE